MCGICGKISLNGGVTKELIRNMCGVLAHRGPDDEGVMTFPPRRSPTATYEEKRSAVGLGHSIKKILGI